MGRPNYSGNTFEYIVTSLKPIVDVAVNSHLRGTEETAELKKILNAQNDSIEDLLSDLRELNKIAPKWVKWGTRYPDKTGTYKVVIRMFSNEVKEVFYDNERCGFMLPYGRPLYWLDAKIPPIPESE